jgi:hypothetical protein
MQGSFPSCGESPLSVRFGVARLSGQGFRDAVAVLGRIFDELFGPRIIGQKGEDREQTGNAEKGNQVSSCSQDFLLLPRKRCFWDLLFLRKGQAGNPVTPHPV